jgi:hypothetical protein
MAGTGIELLGRKCQPGHEPAPEQRHFGARGAYFKNNSDHRQCFELATFSTPVKKM